MLLILNLLLLLKSRSGTLREVLWIYPSLSLTFTGSVQPSSSANLREQASTQLIGA